MSLELAAATKKLTPQKSIDWIQTLLKERDSALSFELDSQKHALIGYRNFEKIFELKMPLPFPKINNDEKVEYYLNRITYPFSPYTIILIQAGYCALGYFENNDVLRHIALRTYMTRKKQGKNQLTYLSNGGRGGSSGGQLRYKNAIRFFEEINEKLNGWNTIPHSTRILYSCPVKMWHYIFDSKVKSCFTKKDARLHKIPLDVRVPNFEEMMRINKYITSGYITFYKQNFDVNLLSG